MSFRNIELLLGLAVSVLIVVLDVRYYNHAGGLWRDEVNSVNLASKPSVLEIWQNNHLDSFPIVWDTLLHGWIYYGPGGADASVRLLGLLIALTALGMYWASARSAGVNVPWVLLVVLGLNATMIVYGSEVRGYGLAVVTELGMLASWLLFAQRPTVARGVLAAAAALLCVQSLFANCIMLAAAGGAWGLVALARRRWKLLALLALFSALAAASVLPYVHTFAKHGEWFDIVRLETSLAYLLHTLAASLSMSSRVLPLVYLVLVPGTVVGCLWFIRSWNPRVTEGHRDLVWWCLLALGLGLGLHFWFMKFLKVRTAVWYCLPILALTALCLEIALDRLIGANRLGQVIRLCLAAVLAVLAGVNSWRESAIRMTGVDLVAAELSERAEPRDLIVVWPWYTACVFNRYYRGSAPWIALPDFEDKMWQRYPVLKEKMHQQDPIRPELERIESTLKGGGRVWLAGGLLFLEKGKVPINLPVGPDPSRPLFWNDNVYTFGWSQQAAHLLQSHSEVSFVPVAPNERCRPEEDRDLYVAEGWH